MFTGEGCCTGEKRREFLRIERIIETEHRNGEPYLGKPLGRLPSNPLRRGIRRPERRVLLLQPPQFGEEPVVLIVRDLRSVQYIVQMLMPQDFLS